MLKIMLVFVITLAQVSCHFDQNPQEIKKMETHSYTNHLIHETSPYLLQHAHNPVNWYPWGEEALEKAEKEDKIILISIGYSACHWCHVMEMESFENEEVAKIMNDFFVCIKVDREERPDIDQIYMNAVQLLSGRGGWPLNCFALPDGRPFYGGTYFAPGPFKELLFKIKDAYINEKGQVLDYAEKLHKGIVQSEMITMKSKKEAFSLAHLETVINKAQQYFDLKNGGQNRAPKFPMPGFYELLLQWSFQKDDPEVRSFVMHTLDKMANGGIYDHLGGGFARYSTDEQWLAPHFEKMLYDNGQMLSLYSKAYRASGSELYKRTIIETIDFVQRELTAADGGFYSAYDADSEGEEGKFYVWQKREIEAVLGEDAATFMAYYNVTEGGNWEHKNILHVNEADQYNSQIARAKQRLFEYRSHRTKPALDDKILTSWNALMVMGLADAYRALENEAYLDMAKKSMQLLIDRQLEADGKLMRNYKNGTASIDGFLDDYALSAAACLSLYQLTFDAYWLQTAEGLVAYTMAHFYDSESAMFFYTSDEAKGLIARKMELSDNVIPSSSSSMARVLFQLGKIVDHTQYSEIALQMLTNFTNSANMDAYFSFNWLGLMCHYVFPYYEVVIAGEEADQLRAAFEKAYHPNVLVTGSKTDSPLPLLAYRVLPGKNLIYVCVENTCQLPVSSVEEACKLLE